MSIMVLSAGDQYHKQHELLMQNCACAGRLLAGGYVGSEGAIRVLIQGQGVPVGSQVWQPRVHSNSPQQQQLLYLTQDGFLMP